jgi:hypothetical protein
MWGGGQAGLGEECKAVFLILMILLVLRLGSNPGSTSIWPWARDLPLRASVFPFLFCWYWGLISGPTPWATPLALFCEGFFQDRVSRNCLPRLASNCYLCSWSLPPE